MSRLIRLSSAAVLVCALPVLATCAAPSSPAPTGGQAAVPPQSSPQLCRLTKPDGGRCVSLQQLPMGPAQTDQGYATQLSWVLTNECSYPMLVSWGWTPGQVVEQAVLQQGQSTQTSCLWNVDGCTGSIDWVYRCSQVQ